MDTHLTISGILHCVFGALTLMTLMALLAVFGVGMFAFDKAREYEQESWSATPEATPPGIREREREALRTTEQVLGVVKVIGGALALAAAALGAVTLLAGVGLLRRRPWGYKLGLVASALELVFVPLGTASGAYGLWVLLTPQTRPLLGLPPGPA